jgi:ribose 5-phosphate isomerase RpiB
MFAGDAIGNNNIQTTDTNSVKVALGAVGYTINDMNMNRDVQTTDLNIILKQIGKSIQF